LLENSGNLPDFSDPEPITYWNAVYFLMVTMSTVGYGDITCLTEVGRVFQLMFLAVGLVGLNISPQKLDKQMTIHLRIFHF